MVNERHGSHARSRLHDALAKASPLRWFLETVRSIRTDLHFQENGVRTLMTVEWNPTEQ